MSLIDSYKDFEEEAKFWLGELEKYNDNPFTTQSHDNTWTMARLYSYLFSCTEYYCRQIQDALISDEKAHTKGNKTPIGIIVFAKKKITNTYLKKFHEKFPEYPALEGVAEAKSRIILSMKMMLNLSRKIQGKENIKIKHEQFGWLKLKDWYKLPRWHFENAEDLKRKVEHHIISRRGIVEELSNS